MKKTVFLFFLLMLVSVPLSAQLKNPMDGFLPAAFSFLGSGRNTNQSLLNRSFTNLIPITNFEISNLSGYEIVSNVSVEHVRVVTNFFISNRIQVYQFFDVYPKLVGITPEMLQEDPKEKIAEFLFPMEDLALSNTEIPWKKKLRLKKIHFITDEILDSFPEEEFKKILWRKKFNKLALTPEEKMHLTFGFEKWETKVIISGYVDIRTGYGWSFKDENNPRAIPGISQGFQINQEMKVNVTGKIGERINVSIDHDSTKNENTYEIGYQALKKDIAIIRELRAGNITLTLPNRSRFIKYSGTSKDSYGLKVGAEYGDFDLQAVLSVTTSLKGRKTFIGTQKKTVVQLNDVNYIKRRYFILPDISIDLNSVEVYRQVSDVNLSDKTIGGLYYSHLVSGVDYYVNTDTGDLNLAHSLSRNDTLLMHYTVGMALFTTNSNTTVVSDDNGKQYFYLWKADWNDSPYLHDGYYAIGVRDFDPTLGFSLNVYQSADSSTLADMQFTTADYQINPISGYIRFNNPHPFTNSYSNLYATPEDPSPVNSSYVMKLTLNSKIDSYQLDFGIIPGTEKVFVNGRELSKSEYTLVYSIGELIFNNKSLINANDHIEVTYEYKPFWGGAQKYGFATRLDWKPSKKINLGGTLVYNLSQRQASAPTIGNTPDGLLLADIDGNINFNEIFRLPKEIRLDVSGEYALSSYDRNTVGYALVDDFEGVGESKTFTKNETRWILAAPPVGISGISYTNRGELLYRDYRSYNLDLSYTLLNFSSSLSTNKVKLYAEKPGPYLVSGGHLSASDYPSLSQTALVFDYNFTHGDWVGAAYSVAGPSGADYSDYNEVSLWVRMENDEDGDGSFTTEGSNKVQLFLVLGQLNEDSDGDGVLDKEESRSDGGYPFNDFQDPTLIKTHVGIGRLGEGDGNIQSEDLNRDGVLTTNGQVVIYPTSAYTEPSSVYVSDGDWKKVSFSIRSLSTVARQTLEHVSSVGLVIKKKDGTRGRLIVDSIEFKKVRWKEKKVDGYSATGSQAIRGEGISVYNNPYYNQHKFYLIGSDDTNADERANVFEKLHGARTISEANQINESSLQLYYNLTNIPYNTNFGIGGTRATLVKRNSYPMDFSAYRYLNFYLYIPDEDENGTAIKIGGDQYENESFVFVLGNTENRYYEWTVPMNQLDKNKWIPVRIQIANDLNLEIAGQSLAEWKQPKKVGNPNIRDVNSIEIGVELNQTNEAVNVGQIWIDEMYVSSDISRFGTAYYLNPVFEYNKPLWTFHNFEIIGPLHVRSTLEGRDDTFKGSAVDNRVQSDWKGNLDTGVRFFKNLAFQMTYNRSFQRASTNEFDVPLYQQWQNEVETTKFSWIYTSRKWIPQLSHTYTETYVSHFDRSLFDVVTNDHTVQKDQDEYRSTVSFNWNQLLPVLPVLTFSPSFQVEDTYSLLSKDQFTNLIDPVYLTNNETYGSETLKKSLLSRLQINFMKLQLLGSYKRLDEKYNKVMNNQTYATLLSTQKSNVIFSRYAERIVSLSEGFYYTNHPFESQQEDTVNVNLQLTKPLSFFSLSANDSLSRRRSGYTYDANGQLNSKYDQYEFRSQGNLYLYPKFLIFDTLRFQMDRTLSYNYRTADYTVDLTNTLPFTVLYYQQPLYFNALVAGDFARTNALSLVKYLSDGQYQSYTRLNDKINIEWTIPNFKPGWTELIPKRYQFSTELATSRNLNSYYQSLQNIVSTTFPLKFSRINWWIFKPGKDLRIGDMNIRLLYKNFLSFNTRKSQDELGLSLNQSVWLSKTMNFNLFYRLNLKKESDYTNYASYESDYGMITNIGNSPYFDKSHQLNFSFNWILRDLKDFKLWGMKVVMKGTTINNKESLIFARTKRDTDGIRFAAYTDKEYELTLDHNTRYQFSQFVTGTLSLKAVLNQLTDVHVSGSEIARSAYKPGYGFQFNLTMRIKF